MQHLDAAKAQQLARAVEAATRGGAGRVGAKDDGRDDVPALLALYYRHVAPEDIVTRDPVDLVAPPCLTSRWLRSVFPAGLWHGPSRRL